MGASDLCEVDNCHNTGCGSSEFCITHGGCGGGGGSGKRCKFESCDMSVQGSTNFCMQCEFEGYDKSAVGSTDCCVSCGGGKQCNFQGCDKGA